MPALSASEDSMFPTPVTSTPPMVSLAVRLSSGFGSSGRNGGLTSLKACLRMRTTIVSPELTGEVRTTWAM
jgi:hypothetical protein